MTTLTKLLKQLSDDHNERGREFEEICRWFLLNDPVYNAQIEKVYLWDEWPGRWGPDAGIDLIAKAKDGKIWAIQAKAYDPQYPIKKADVDSFLSESSHPKIDYRLLVATTNKLGNTARKVIERQEKPVGLLLLGDLEQSAAKWPTTPSALAPARPSPKDPHPYQVEAIQAVVDSFNAGEKRGQLIMACGTGKTLISLWVNEATLTLFFLPI